MDAVRLAWRYDPAFFIFTCGSLLLFPSLLILGWITYKYLFTGTKHFVWAIIGVVGTGVGAVSLLLAIMALFIKRVERRLIEKLERLRDLLC